MQNRPNNNHSVELTGKACILAILLAIIFAASNAYLGLKIGFIISVSIPAAVIAMVAFRLWGAVNILEVNIVQTGASASGSLATDIVYILPALMLIGYWDDMNYWQTVIICITGGILGILFSIPMRRTLLSHPELKFPEGVAIATMLQTTTHRSTIRELLLGGLAGSLLQLAQQGFGLVSSAWQIWYNTGKCIIGLGMGFDAAMFGAGYIIGFNVGFSILLGAVAGWVIGVPILSALHSGEITNISSTAAVMGLWSSYIRYLGVGALLAAGVWSLLLCLKPILNALYYSVETIKKVGKTDASIIPRTEQDLPGWSILLGIILLFIITTLYIQNEFKLQQLGISSLGSSFFLITTLIYILVAGFVFSAICSYFSGLVGMSASPISSANIAIVILFSLIILIFLPSGLQLSADTPQVLHAAGLAIIVATIVGGAASMANGTIQDLKTGEIVGATPWKLQLMLIIGTLASTFIVPLVISILYHAYGIGSSYPATLTDHSQALPAPQATIIATLTRGVFLGGLPYKMIGIGICMVVLLIITKKLGQQKLAWFSILGFGLAVYLPMVVTFPLFIGSMVAGLVSYCHRRQARRQGNSNFVTLADDQSQNKNLVSIQNRNQVKATLIATGLIAGGSLMGVFLAIPAALTGESFLWQLVSDRYAIFTNMVGLIILLGLCYWIYAVATSNE